MKDDDIRFLYLTRMRTIKTLSISRYHIQIINLVAMGYNTTTKLQKKLDKSVQGISTVLTTLYKKGYLAREQTIQRSGGIEYSYSIRIHA